MEVLRSDGIRLVALGVQAIAKKAPSGDYGWGWAYPPELRLCPGCGEKLTLKVPLWFVGMPKREAWHFACYLNRS